MCTRSKDPITCTSRKVKNPLLKYNITLAVTVTLFAIVFNSYMNSIEKKLVKETVPTYKEEVERLRFEVKVLTERLQVCQQTPKKQKGNEK